MKDPSLRLLALSLHPLIETTAALVHLHSPRDPLSAFDLTGAELTPPRHTIISTGGIAPCTRNHLQGLWRCWLSSGRLTVREAPPGFLSGKKCECEIQGVTLIETLIFCRLSGTRKLQSRYGNVILVQGQLITQWDICEWSPKQELYPPTCFINALQSHVLIPRRGRSII